MNALDVNRKFETIDKMPRRGYNQALSTLGVAVETTREQSLGLSLKAVTS